MLLQRQGRIERAQFIAAEQIGEMWEAISIGRNLQAADLEPKIRADGPYRGLLERMPASLEWRLENVWMPWANEMGKLFLANERGGEIRGGISYLTIAIDIAAEHISFSNLVSSLGCDRVTGTERLKTVFLHGCDRWISADESA